MCPYGQRTTRRRVWRAATRAAREARETERVAGREREKWEKVATERKESNTPHVVFHLPRATTTPTTPAAATAAAVAATRLQHSSVYPYFSNFFWLVNPPHLLFFRRGLLRHWFHWRRRSKLTLIGTADPLFAGSGCCGVPVIFLMSSPAHLSSSLD